jgi:hypothetical protein
MHTCINNLRLFLSFSTIATTTDLRGLRAIMNIVYGLGLPFVYNLCTTPHVTYYVLLEVLRFCLRFGIRTTNGIMNVEYFLLTLKAASSKKNWLFCFLAEI